MLGSIAAIVTLVPAYSQTGGGSARVVHFTLNWIDSARPEPWTPDANDHRGIASNPIAGVHRSSRRGPPSVAAGSRCGRDPGFCACANLDGLPWQGRDGPAGSGIPHGISRQARARYAPHAA